MPFASIPVLLDRSSCLAVGADASRSEHGDPPHCNHGGREVCAKGGRGGSEGVNSPARAGVVCNLLVDPKNSFARLDVGEVAGVEGRLGTLVQGHGGHVAGHVWAARLKHGQIRRVQAGIGQTGALEVVQAVDEKLALRDADGVRTCPHQNQTLASQVGHDEGPRSLWTDTQMICWRRDHD